jgi:hypothetical protein
MMERKSVKVEEGFTQAERVKDPDRSREFESGIIMLSSMPSKYNALPTFPAVHWGPLINVPVFPLPEESKAVVPAPSSNVQWATRPEVAASLSETAHRIRINQTTVLNRHGTRFVRRRREATPKPKEILGMATYSSPSETPSPGRS